MPDETTPPNNFDRLLKHLKEKSLAGSLVQAHRHPTASTPRESMIVVLRVGKIRIIENDTPNRSIF